MINGHYRLQSKTRDDTEIVLSMTETNESKDDKDGG